MQQAIEHHNRSSDEPLGVRIGISIGEATEEADDYFGDPVVEAARLCAAADGGQILITDMLRMMVGRHATQTFVELGPTELKGLPEPVDVVEVLWEPAVVEGSVPLPGRIVGAATDALFGFFGRTAELEVLEEVRKTARSSQRCQVVFIAGEAGMGKTSLSGQAARRAHGDGAVVLLGHADEDLGVSYQPWIEALTRLVQFGDPQWVSGLRSAQRNAFARLVPELGADADRVADPETERLLLLEGATELLIAASQQSPVMVVLDDLHWADSASLQLLRHVTASATPMNVTIVCTLRDADLARGDQLTKLLADMHRESNVTRIALKGLEDNELVDLLTAAAGHDLDDDGIGLAHAVRRETDGNPFFTAELLRHLGESGGILLGDDGRWVLAGELEELGLPTSVRDVVGRRVERLGDEALRVLCLAAVIGREFDLALLASLTDIGEDPLLDLLDVAVNAAVLVESDSPDRYRFAHALIQHSLYDELSPARRLRAHQRIAETLETATATQDAATLAELAHHWVAATRPAHLHRALDYVRRAGDAARDALAPNDAIRWYQQALDLIAQQPDPDQHQRAELLATLGAVQRQAADPGYRDTLLEAAALAALAAAHDATLEWHARRDFSIQALDVARHGNLDATFVHVLDIILASHASPDYRDQLIADVERAVEIADRSGDPVLRSRIRLHLVWVRVQQVDPSGADAVLRELEALTEAVGLPQQQWQVALMDTGRLLWAGDIVAADAANERALELGIAANAPEAFGAYGGYLYAIRLNQGRLDEIADLLIDAARDNPSLAVMRSLVAVMLGHLGRVEEAAERLGAEAAGGFDFPFDQTWLSSMSDLLDAAVATRDRTAPRTLVNLVSPFATHVVEPTTALLVGAIARPLARAATLLGDHDRAEDWFAIAHDIHVRLRAPFWTALGQLDHADLCLDRGAGDDPERARGFVAMAASTAAEYGFAGLTRRADKLLAGL